MFVVNEKLLKLMLELEKKNIYAEHIPYSGYPEKVVVNEFQVYIENGYFVMDEVFQDDTMEIYETKQLKRIINLLEKRLSE